MSLKVRLRSPRFAQGEVHWPYPAVRCGLRRGAAAWHPGEDGVFVAVGLGEIGGRRQAGGRRPPRGGCGAWPRPGQSSLRKRR